tara:strand:- start:4298 stop:4558 length:261 start_codon:yes stop_codon:yes gene_type:complete
MRKEDFINLARSEDLPALVGMFDHLSSVAEAHGNSILKIMAQNPADDYHWSDNLGEYRGKEIALMAQYASDCIRMVYGLREWDLNQ